MTDSTIALIEPVAWQWRYRYEDCAWFDWNDGRAMSWVKDRDGMLYEERALVPATELTTLLAGRDDAVKLANLSKALLDDANQTIDRMNSEIVQMGSYIEKLEALVPHSPTNVDKFSVLSALSAMEAERDQLQGRLDELLMEVEP